LKSEFERFGMPLMFKPWDFQPNGKDIGYMAESDLEEISTVASYIKLRKEL
jgi:hypothetical protein